MVLGSRSVVRVDMLGSRDLVIKRMPRVVRIEWISIFAICVIYYRYLRATTYLLPPPAARPPAYGLPNYYYTGVPV